MSDQESIQLLDHLDRMQRAQWTREQPLVGIDFVNRDLQLSALRTQAQQVAGRIAIRLQQRGKQTVGVAGSGRVIIFVTVGRMRDVFAQRTAL